MPNSPQKSACIIIIGNEILSGRTQDTNTAYIAQKLCEKGVRLQEVRVIPDIEKTIVDTVRWASAHHDYVFTTGGIGPTHDDITAPSIAKAFNVECPQNQDAYQILLDHYGEDELTDARLRMARIPVGADLIPNPVSAAPGFRMKNVHVMAGIPKIMQAMLDYILTGMESGAPILSVSIPCALPESRIAEGLGEIQNRYPDIDIGSYPHIQNGVFGVNVVVRTTDKHLLHSAEKDIIAMITEAETKTPA